MLIELQEMQKLAANNNAITIINAINDELERQLNLHKYLYDLLWNDTTATPQEICDTLMAKGLKPTVLFAISAKNKTNLEEICSLCGKNLTELLDSSYLTPKLPFDINQDGSVTIKG